MSTTTKPELTIPAECIDFLGGALASDEPLVMSGDRVLVKHSRAGLESVLVRHLGTVKEGVQWWNKTPEHALARHHYVRALAAAVVWFARIARACKMSSEVPDDPEAAMGEHELDNDLPPLEVSG